MIIIVGAWIRHQITQPDIAAMKAASRRLIDLLPSGLYRRLRLLTESTLRQACCTTSPSLDKGHGLDPSQMRATPSVWNWRKSIMSTPHHAPKIAYGIKLLTAKIFYPLLPMARPSCHPERPEGAKDLLGVLANNRFMEILCRFSRFASCAPQTCPERSRRDVMFLEVSTEPRYLTLSFLRK
jgi:hypothetical protein